MFEIIKRMFNNKSKELELKSKEIEIRRRENELEMRKRAFEIEIKRRENEIKKREMNIKNNKNEFKPYTPDEKKAYAQKMKDLKQKGKEYEEFVGAYYKLDGYKIDLHGIKNGKKDKGIDIICEKDNELILIQCKNWKESNKYKINHEKLKAFVGSCTEYINENKLFHKNIKLKFITSNYILDESGKKFLEETKILQYEILKY